jgi:glycosyltransferase involved in cell wall biosynthesis
MTKPTKKSKHYTVSVVIPVYNEENTIEDVIAIVQEKSQWPTEIIVVDDGSTDATRKHLKKYSDTDNIKVILQPTNQGKGAALRAGIALAHGQIVIIQDADLEYDPTDYPQLVEPILSGRADVVYGSRFVGGQPHRTIYFWNKMANNLLTLLSNLTTNMNLTDMETGYKAFRREVIQSINLQENDFGFEPEVTAKVAAAGFSIYEVGISYYGRTYEEGKKITPADFFTAVWVILKWGVLRPDEHSK